MPYEHDQDMIDARQSPCSRMTERSCEGWETISVCPAVTQTLAGVPPTPVWVVFYRRVRLAALDGLGASTADAPAASSVLRVGRA